MARKVGQIIARGDRRWLIRVYLGRDHDTQKTQIPQPNDPRSHARSAGVPGEKAAQARLGS
jgi:hypothetical protein